MTAEQLGLDLRDQGVADTIEAANAWWLAVFRLAADYVTQPGVECTIDDVRAWCTVEPRSSATWGAAWRCYVTAEGLEYVAHRRSTRPSAHARAVAVYRRPVTG